MPENGWDNPFLPVSTFPMVLLIPVPLWMVVGMVNPYNHKFAMY